MLWSRRHAVAAMGSVLALAACGFQPLYGRRSDDDRSLVEMAAIDVLPVPDRIGQILRNELSDRLTPRGVPAVPRYRLGVSMSRSREGLAIERDESATRINLTVRVSYRLMDAASGDVLTNGIVRAVAAFNVVQSEFANIAAENDAEVRAARDVSEEIRNRLGVYFSQSLRGGRS